MCIRERILEQIQSKNKQEKLNYLLKHSRIFTFTHIVCWLLLASKDFQNWDWISIKLSLINLFVNVYPVLVQIDTQLRITAILEKHKKSEKYIKTK